MLKKCALGFTFVFNLSNFSSRDYAVFRLYLNVPYNINMFFSLLNFVLLELEMLLNIAVLVG